MDPAITLCTTVHDPDARLMPLLLAHETTLRGRYRSIHVSATIATDAAVIARLRGLGASVDTRAGAEIGTARRNVVANALRSISHLVLYCDFDRWLHWQSTFPDELLELPGQLSRRHPHAWYFSLGRTPRAFESHPRVQRNTENQSNLVATIALGTDLDVTAGACMMTVAGAKLIVSQSIERSNATDGEWPVIIWRSGVNRVGGVQCDGLEFETASFYGKEILDHGGPGELGGRNLRKHRLLGTKNGSRLSHGIGNRAGRGHTDRRPPCHGTGQMRLSRRGAFPVCNRRIATHTTLMSSAGRPESRSRASSNSIAATVCASKSAR